MRFNLALAAASVASLSVAVVEGYENAAVFNIGKGHGSESDTDKETIKQDDYILNLSLKLGIDQFYEIADDANLRQVLGERNERKSDGQMTIIVEGVENPAEFFQEWDMEPKYEVEINNRLKLQDFISGIQEKMETTNKYSARLSRTISLFMNQSTEEKFQALTNLLKVYFYGAEKQENGVLALHKQDQLVEELSEFDLLINKLSKVGDMKNDDKVVVRFQSLSGGKTSSRYTKAKNAITKLIMNKLGELDSMDCHVVVLPQYIKKTTIAKRENVSQTSSCYLNELSCIESSDSCSGHGVCAKVGECWKCLCSATKNESKDQTTYWTGSSCEKIDYSSEFQMFLWTTIIIVIMIVSGVKLLNSCGSEELPGVLLAATVQTKKN